MRSCFSCFLMTITIAIALVCSVLLLAGCGGNPGTADALNTPAGSLSDATAEPAPQATELPANVLDLFGDSAFGISEGEGIILKFTGSAPNGSIEIRNTFPESDPLSKVTFMADPDTGLSNGDSVTIVASISGDEYKLLERTRVITVQGLSEAAELDPFDLLTVTFEGVSPKGKVRMQVDSSRPETEYIEFEASRIGVLAEGDQITVTAKLTEDEQRFTERFGEVLSTTKKVYTVTGLQTYITSLDDVGDELMAAMRDQAMNVINAEVATWKNGRLRGTQFLGCYFETPKAGYKTDKQNIIKLIYRISATAVYQDFSKDVDYYYGVTFYNMLETDGHANQTVNLTDFDKNYTYNGVAVDTGYSYYGLKLNVYFQGYPTLDALYQNSVARYLDKYDLVSTVVDK